MKEIHIPENATNGDVLCMLFPYMHYTLSDSSPRVVTTIGIASSFDVGWWNAPYNTESEESNFSISTEQYKLDLQGAYDCGFNCGYADAMNDIAESEE